jgi:hypothetical protein
MLLGKLCSKIPLSTFPQPISHSNIEIVPDDVPEFELDTEQVYV